MDMPDKVDFYRRVLEASPNPVAFFRDGCYVDCNPALLELYGLDSADQVIGKPAGSFSPDRQPGGRGSQAEAAELIRRCSDSGPLTVKWHSVRSDGVTITANILLQCIDPTEPPLVVGFLQDITELSKSREQLVRREAYLSDIIENSPVAIMVCSARSGEISKINRSGRQLLSMTDGSTRGLRAGDLLEVPPDWFHFVRQMKRSGQTTTEVVLRKTSGKPVHAMVTCRQDPQVEDQLLAWAVDLSAQKEIQKELHASRERFRELSSHAPVGIFVADASGSFQYANPKAVEICGVDPKAMLGLGWSAHLHPDDHRSVFEEWRAFASSGAVFNKEFRFVDGNGKVTWVAGAAVPFVAEADRQNTLLGTLTDITRIKLIERELEASRNEALRANNAKSEFLSRMSHELRTPMNAILGFGQLLKMHGESLSVDQKDAVDHILAGGEHLLELIEDVLDFSRIDSGHISLTMQRVPTDKAIRRSLALIMPLARQAGIQVEPPDDPIPEVIADPHRLQQVLVNLLTNAIKYNQRRGRIRVHGESLQSGRVRIHVIDTGEGIRREDRERLFKPFERITDSTLMIEGTGIGLSLCKQLMELMGGNIDFTSERGEGTDFWIDLPSVAKNQIPDVQHESKGGTVQLPSISGLKILYVEDHLASIELMMEVMRVFEDCEVVTSTNAADGIAIARSAPPDLVLMDIGLSGMDGIEALKLLKSDARTRSIPVIALSASALPDTIEEGLAAGFEQFLIKPLKFDRLFDAIWNVLDRQKEEVGRG